MRETERSEGSIPKWLWPHLRTCAVLCGPGWKLDVSHDFHVTARRSFDRTSPHTMKTFDTLWSGLVRTPRI
jgi:hypothetical protein